MGDVSADVLAAEILRDLAGSQQQDNREALCARLQRGMELYPSHRDKFGDPLFRKELMRLLLAEGRFEEARALIPAEDGKEAGWHQILFARALDMHQRRQESRPYWQAVLRRSPGSPEAQAALGLQSAAAEGSPPIPPSQSATPPLPQMSRAEIALFQKWLKGVGTFLEFGAGGSTSFAALQGVPRIYSVESDIQWLQLLAARPELRAVEFHQVHIDIGPVGAYGTPTDPSKATSWPAYYSKVWQLLAAAPDLVLVDGRFRVACTLSTILHAKAGVPILIHDFWNRPAYHRVLSYLDPIDRAETLGVFRAKADLDLKELAVDLIRHALVYG